MRKKFIEAEEAYLKAFGADSLDRVVLVDPLHESDEAYFNAIQEMEQAVKSGVPLEQADPELWKSIIF